MLGGGLVKEISELKGKGRSMRGIAEQVRGTAGSGAL